MFLIGLLLQGFLTKPRSLGLCPPRLRVFLSCLHLQSSFHTRGFEETILESKPPMPCLGQSISYMGPEMKNHGPLIPHISPTASRKHPGIPDASRYMTKVVHRVVQPEMPRLIDPILFSHLHVPALTNLGTHPAVPRGAMHEGIHSIPDCSILASGQQVRVSQ